MINTTLPTVLNNVNNFNNTMLRIFSNRSITINDKMDNSFLRAYTVPIIILTITFICLILTYWTTEDNNQTPESEILLPRTNYSSHSSSLPLNRFRGNNPLNRPV